MSFKSPYRMLQGWRRIREAAMGFVPAVPYWQQIIDDYAPDRYWPLFDVAGPAAVELIAADDGTYVGPTLTNALNPNGLPCPLFDGINDRVQIALPGNTFPGVFDGHLMTSIIAGRVFNIGVWTDAGSRALYGHGFNAANRLGPRKNIVNNRVSWVYEASNIQAVMDRNGENTTAWFTIGMTVNRVANRVRFFWNGVQEGIDQAHPAVWVGVINNAQTAIGDRQGAVPNRPWHGWLSDHLYWAGRELTPAEFADVDARLRAL